MMIKYRKEGIYISLNYKGKKIKAFFEKKEDFENFLEIIK